MKTKMNLNAIVEARIHPAIGIARVGNAPGYTKNDYFIGPQLPYAVGPPSNGYRDAQGRIKRQAAEFRIYGYDKQGEVVGELTDDVADITWHVEVANKKASWYNFDAPLDIPEASSLRMARRNAQIQGAQRAKLSITPGPRTVSKIRHRSIFNSGTFFGNKVYLGEIHYSDKGRLHFLGGHGKSEPVSPAYTLTTFANNAGWHDDISDGPVSAAVRIGKKILPVTSAWVVTAPPNYAPDLVATQPLYDVIVDALAPMAPAAKVPIFGSHILPIFRQFQDSQWVNAGFATQFGWHGLIDFTREHFITMLATAPFKLGDQICDPFKELRFQIFNSFRNPAFQSFDPVGWPPLYGDAFESFDSPVSPRAGFAATEQSYGYLQSWMNGNFSNDDPAAPPMPPSIDHVAIGRQPETLDHAALHFCVGGPFHPGVELTWPMRRFSMYSAKFRLRERDRAIPEPDYGDFMTQDIATADGGPLSASGPGDLTKWMAVPWQSDTAGCRGGYGKDFPENDVFLPSFWPSRVPNQVLSEESYQVIIDPARSIEERRAAFARRDQWLAPLNLDATILSQLTTMIDHFHELGILEPRHLSASERNAGEDEDDFPKVIYVQQLPHSSPRVRRPVCEFPNLMKDVQNIRLGPKGRRR